MVLGAHVYLEKTKCTKRNDTGHGRKHSDEEAFGKEFVETRWEEGDPIGRFELYGELYAQDDCAEDTEFYKSYIDPSKSPAASVLSNWVGRVLDQYGWSMRKNSIGQTMPED